MYYVLPLEGLKLFECDYHNPIHETVEKFLVVLQFNCTLLYAGLDKYSKYINLYIVSP